MPFERFSVIESTLREGEQFSTATFATQQKIEIAALLDEFGVEMIEMTSPCASQRGEDDIRAVLRESFSARILTHIRCNKDDAARALDTGVLGQGQTISYRMSAQLIERHWQYHPRTAHNHQDYSRSRPVRI
jgi:homocitrate synthase